MSTYYYQFVYDVDKDNFNGTVESLGGVVVFNIANIGDMRDLIKTNVMNHIDDIEGLEGYLKFKQVIDLSDQLQFFGVN